MAGARVRKRTWRERLGLQPPPPDPDEWVPVTSASVDDVKTGSSRQASRLAKTLEAAGIETQLKPYVVPDPPTTRTSGPDVADRIRVAVLVHHRDSAQARERLRSLDEESARRRQRERDQISDDELTRLSLEAPEELKGQAADDG
jgi:hypothetical protein